MLISINAPFAAMKCTTTIDVEVLMKKLFLIVLVVVLSAVAVTVHATDISLLGIDFSRVCSKCGCTNYITFTDTGDYEYSDITSTTHVQHPKYSASCGQCGNTWTVSMGVGTTSSHSFSTSSSPAPGGGYYITHYCACGYSFTERDTSHINSHLGELCE